MQTDRRTNPYPLTWEVPTGTAVILLGLLVLAAHLGRAAANLIDGHGWAWPAATQLVTSLPALLAGDAAAGLTATGPLAPAGLLWAWIGVTEFLTIAAITTLGTIALQRWGPGRMRGMATATAAEGALGLTRLRKVRHIIRPDVYPPRRPPSPTTPETWGRARDD